MKHPVDEIHEDELAGEIMDLQTGPEVLFHKGHMERWQHILDGTLAFNNSIFDFINDVDIEHGAHGLLGEGSTDDERGVGPEGSISTTMSDEDAAKIRALQEQNAAILARMSRLMQGLREKAEGGREEEQERKRAQQETFVVRIEKPPREDYGLDLNMMKKWVAERNEKLLLQENYKQEMAVGKLRGFLDCVRMVTRLQTWFRMIRFRKEFAEFRGQRLAVKRKFYTAWKQQWRADKMHLYQTIGKPFLGWATETCDSKKLRLIVQEFFAMCIKRLKLTPQAVIVFFAKSDPEEKQSIISEPDLMKIRRLILSRLFAGWRTETRDLRGRRFKGAQILTRTMRKHKGPLWVKEGLLVCYHIWYRYTAVRAAYRKDEPDPVFKNPFLPQWALLIQKITMSRIHRKRAQEKAEMMLYKRNFRNWRVAMTIDRSKMLTPMAIAINHHTNKVWTKVFGAWCGYLRERGKINRLRDSCFIAWKGWAPRKRRLRSAKTAAIRMRDLNTVHRAYKRMTALCYDVIGRRAVAMRHLRENFQNRKVMICAYGLMNRQSHVVMLGCWRRWCLWSKSRNRWANTLWNYRFLHYDIKMRAIIQAWRSFASAQIQDRGGTAVTGISTVNVGRSRASSPEGASRAAEYEFQREAQEWSQQLQPKCLQIFRLAQQDSYEERPNEEAFLLFCRAIAMSRSGRAIVSKSRAEILNDDEEGSLAESQLTEAKSGAKDKEPAFLDGHYSKCGSLQDGSLTVRSRLTDGGAVEAASLAIEANERDGSEIGGEDGNDDGDDGNGDDADSIMNEPSIASISAGLSLTESVKLLLSEVQDPTDPKEEAQAKLQRGIDVMDMRVVALAVEEGAQINEEHVKQVASHFGDYCVPLFVQLLTGSLDFMAQRVLMNDRLAVVLQCANPINALVASEHISRWEKRIVTAREIKALTQDRIISSVVGSLFSSVNLFRVLVILMLKRKEDLLRRNSTILPQTRTEEQEVRETMKRNTLKRVIYLRRSISALMGVEFVEGSSLLYDLNKYPEPPPVVGEVIRHNFVDNSWTKNMGVEELLLEYTTLARNLQSEALALRAPQLNRDDKLLERGFIKQSRKDFLALRQLTLSEAERKAQAAKEKEKMRKAAQKAAKERRKLEKMYEQEFYNSVGDGIDEEGDEGGEVDGENGGGDDDGEGGEDGEDGADEDEDQADESTTKAAAVKGKTGKKVKENKPKAKKGKAKKGKATGAIEETDEMREAFQKLDDKDEYHESLKPFDPVTFSDREFILSSLVAPAELKDQENEQSYFEPRRRLYPDLLLETWMPSGKKHIREVRITLAARACKTAAMVPRRCLALISQASNFLSARGSATGGFGGWIIACATDTSSAFNETDRELWPKEYWDLFQIEAKLKLNKVLLRATMRNLTNSVQHDISISDDVAAQKRELEEFLSEHREGLVEIGERRKAKVSNDAYLSRDNEKRLLQHQNQLADLEAKKSAILDKVASTEVFFASGNFQHILLMFGEDVGSITGTESDASESDRQSKLHLRARQVVQAHIEEAAALDPSIQETRDLINDVDREIHSFSRFCRRADNWMRSMALSHFNMMTDAQQIIQRFIKDRYEISRRLGSAFPWISIYKKKVKENKEVLKFITETKNKHVAQIEAAIEEDRRVANLPPGRVANLLPGSRVGSPSPRRQRKSRGPQTALDDSFSMPLSASDAAATSLTDEQLTAYLKIKASFYEGEISVDETAVLDVELEVGHLGLEPRKLTLEEEEMILMGTSAAEIAERRAREEQEAREAAEAAERERQQLIQEKLALDAMQRALAIEQEAMLVMHKQRAKIFDDYWDLIMPFNMDKKAVDSRAVSRGGSESRPLSPNESQFKSAAVSTFSGAKISTSKSAISDDVFDEMGLTRRQWVAIGDEHWKSKRGLSQRQVLVQMAVEEGGPDPSDAMRPAVESSTIVPPLPCEVHVGVAAWRNDAIVMSVTMSKDQNDDPLQQLMSNVATSNSGPFQPSDVDSVVGSTRDSFSQAPSRNGSILKKSTPQVISRASDDPFVVVGKKELAGFQASLVHMRKSAYDLDDGDIHTTDTTAMEDEGVGREGGGGREVEHDEQSEDASHASNNSYGEKYALATFGLDANADHGKAGLVVDREQEEARANLEEPMRELFVVPGGDQCGSLNEPIMGELPDLALSPPWSAKADYVTAISDDASAMSALSREGEGSIQSEPLRAVSFSVVASPRSLSPRGTTGGSGSIELLAAEAKAELEGFHHQVEPRSRATPVITKPERVRFTSKVNDADEIDEFSDEALAAEAQHRAQERARAERVRVEELPHYDYSSMHLGAGLQTLPVGGRIDPPPTEDEELLRAQDALRRAEHARTIEIPKLATKRLKHSHLALTGAQATLPEKPRPIKQTKSLFLAGRAPDVPSAISREIKSFNQVPLDPEELAALRLGDGSLYESSLQLDYQGLNSNSHHSLTLSASLGLPSRSFSRSLELPTSGWQGAGPGSGTALAASLDSAVLTPQRSFASLLAMVHAELSDAGNGSDGDDHKHWENEGQRQSTFVDPKPRLILPGTIRNSRGLLLGREQADRIAAAAAQKAAARSAAAAAVSAEAKAAAATAAAAVAKTVSRAHDREGAPSPSTSVSVTFSRVATSPREAPGAGPDVGAVTGAGSLGSPFAGLQFDDSRPNSASDMIRAVVGSSQVKVKKRPYDTDDNSTAGDEFTATGLMQELRPLTPETLVMLGSKVRKLLGDKLAHDMSLVRPEFTRFSQSTRTRKLTETFLRRKDNYLHFAHTADSASMAVSGQPKPLAMPPGLVLNTALFDDSGHASLSLWPSTVDGSREGSPLLLSPSEGARSAGMGGFGGQAAAFDVRKQKQGAPTGANNVLPGREYLDFDAAFARLQGSSSLPVGIGKLSPDTGDQTNRQAARQSARMRLLASSDSELLGLGGRTAAQIGHDEPGLKTRSGTAGGSASHDKGDPAAAIELPVTGYGMMFPRSPLSRSLLSLSLSKGSATVVASASAQIQPPNSAPSGESPGAGAGAGASSPYARQQQQQQALLQELEGLYARLLADDDGSLELAYAAALGLVPSEEADAESELIGLGQASKSGGESRGLPALDDECFAEDGDENDNEDEDEDGDGEDAWDDSVSIRSAPPNAPAPLPASLQHLHNLPPELAERLATHSPQHPNAFLLKPSSRPGSGLSFMRVASPLPASPSGRLRPRVLSAGAALNQSFGVADTSGVGSDSSSGALVAEGGLTAQLEQRRLRRTQEAEAARQAEAAEAEAAAAAAAAAEATKASAISAAAASLSQAAIGQTLWERQQVAALEDRPLTPQARAALRLLGDTALRQLASPIKAPLVTMGRTGAGEKHVQAPVQTQFQTRESALLYTRDAETNAASGKFVLDDGPGLGLGMGSVQDTTSLILSSVPAPTAPSPAAATSASALSATAGPKPGGGGKTKKTLRATLPVAKPPPGHPLSRPSSRDLPASNASVSASGSAPVASLGSLASLWAADGNWLQQQQQQALPEPWARAQRFTASLADEDEAELEMALRGLLGGGRGKQLGALMASDQAAGVGHDSAAALLAAETSGGIRNNPFAKQRGAKGKEREKQPPRLGGGKLLPPLDSSGSAEVLMRELRESKDPAQGLLDVSKLAQPEISGRGRAPLISKGWEETKRSEGGLQERRGFRRSTAAKVS